MENIQPHKEVKKKKVSLEVSFFEDIRKRFSPYLEQGEKFDGNSDDYHEFMSQVIKDINYFAEENFHNKSDKEFFLRKMLYLRTYPHTTKNYYEI